MKAAKNVKMQLNVMYVYRAFIMIKFNLHAEKTALRDIIRVTISYVNNVQINVLNVLHQKIV